MVNKKTNKKTPSKKPSKPAKKPSNQLTKVINEDGVIKVEAPQEDPAVRWDGSRGPSVVMESGVITVKAPANPGQSDKTTCKKVITFDMNKKQNGYIVELFKDGRFTTVYLSQVDAGGFKGFHMHKVREANYVCLKGKVKIILYTAAGREEHILSVEGRERLHIPTNVPTGLSNEWDEDAWIVNFPSPAYDPELKGEQVDFTEEQCERGEYPGATRRVKWGSDKK